MDLLLTHLTHVAFLVLHQLAVKMQTKGFVLATARARAQPSFILLSQSFHFSEDQKMRLA